MPNKLESIELWDAQRTGAITLPVGETFLNACSGYNQPTVRSQLGRPSEMTMVLNPTSLLATASSSQTYRLRKKKIIRLVYDDASFQEWRIKRTERQTSGQQGFQIVCEPIERDLAHTNMRKSLSTGDVVTNLSFYGETLTNVLSAILTSTYNCPSLFIKGDIEAGVASELIRASFNGANFNQVLNELARQAEAEWFVSWSAVDSAYKVDFYDVGEFGGGQTEAPDRIIGMGGTLGNRENLLVQSSEEDFFSRVIPIAGQGNDTIGIGDITFTPTFNTGTTYSIDKDLILENDFLLGYDETVYVGNATDGWREITDSVSPNIVTLASTNTFTEVCRFALGASKTKLIYLEDPDAVADFGIEELTYRRTDIGPYTNLIEQAGVTPDMSSFTSGRPTGTALVGTPTVTEETGDEFVKFGSKSAKVVADVDEGLSFTVDIDNAYPYFSLLTYLYVSAGSVKVEFEDSGSNLVPEGQFAETNSSNVQGLSLSGAQPASGTATIRVVALEASTTFYIDGWTLTNSATAQQLLPFMGAVDLWTESGTNLIQFGGNQPDGYTGKCWDESYFDGTSLEITLGSWVTVKDGWNGTTHDIDFEGRVLELSYVDEFKLGRLKKTVKISNRKEDLEQFLSQTYVSRQDVQDNQDIPVVPSLDALGLAIKAGKISVSREGVMTLISAIIGQFSIIKSSGKTTLTGGANDLDILSGDAIKIEAKSILNLIGEGGINISTSDANQVIQFNSDKYKLTRVTSTMPATSDFLYKVSDGAGNFYLKLKS